MKLTKLLTTLTIAGVLSAVAFSVSATPSAKDFVAKASEADLFEIQSSKLALDKSQNDDVKSFAQQMIDDHTTSTANLKKALETANSDAQPSTSLNSRHAKIVSKLNGLSGSDFDKKYVSAQKSAHKDAVSLFSSYAKNGDNDTLKDFAGKTLPTLQKHLDHVKKLSSSM